MFLFKVLQGWAIIVWVIVARLITFPFLILLGLSLVGLKAAGKDMPSWVNNFFEWYMPLTVRKNLHRFDEPSM